MATRTNDAKDFAGFGPRVVAFFDQLGENNDRDWFKANRREYDEQIAEPLQALAAALEPEFGPAKIFRPYRDVRFSADKAPIKEQASMATGMATGLAFYFQVSADGLLLAGGRYQPDREHLQRFRTLLDDPVTAAEVHRMIDTVSADGFVLLDEGRLRGAPRGFRADHPEIDLLRQTSLAIGRSEPPPAWLSTPGCVEHVRDAWRVVRRWNDWLDRRRL